MSNRTAAQQREYYDKNKEHLQKYQRDRYDNSDKRKAQVAAQSKRWDAENPEKRIEASRRWRKKHGREHHLRRHYGIGVDDYNAMLAKQDGRCAICGREDPGAGRDHLYVDHIHVDGFEEMPPEEKRGYVRGLLCATCNRHLGIVEKDQFGERALEYLSQARSVNVRLGPEVDKASGS